MKSFKWIAGIALSLLLAGLAAKSDTTSETCKADCCVEQPSCCPK